MEIVPEGTRFLREAATTKPKKKKMNACVFVYPVELKTESIQPKIYGETWL